MISIEMPENKNDFENKSFFVWSNF